MKYQPGQLVRIPTVDDDGHDLVEVVAVRADGSLDVKYPQGDVNTVPSEIVIEREF